MPSRVENRSLTIPGALLALQALDKRLARRASRRRHPLSVKLRASRGNICSSCGDLPAHELEVAGEPDRRPQVVASNRRPFLRETEQTALEPTVRLT